MSLERIEKLLEEHNERSEQTAKKVSEMHFILMGNPDAKIPGLAEKVHRHDKYINADRKLKYTLSGVFAGANVGFWAWVKHNLGI